jgi:hypothetical protein
VVTETTSSASTEPSTTEADQARADLVTYLEQVRPLDQQWTRVGRKVVRLAADVDAGTVDKSTAFEPMAQAA